LKGNIAFDISKVTIIQAAPPENPSELVRFSAIPHRFPGRRFSIGRRGVKTSLRRRKLHRSQKIRRSSRLVRSRQSREVSESPRGYFRLESAPFEESRAVTAPRDFHGGTQLRAIGSAEPRPHPPSNLPPVPAPRSISAARTRGAGRDG